MVLKKHKKEGSKMRKKPLSQVVSFKDPQLTKEENKSRGSCNPTGSPHNMSHVFLLRIRYFGGHKPPFNAPVTGSLII